MVEQVPNIENFGTLFEPINSPEYNQYCKEVGLVISYVGGKFLHYVEPGGGTMIVVHHPMFDGKKPIPFRLNENYKDPREVTREFWDKAWASGDMRLVHLDKIDNVQDRDKQE